MHVEINPTVVTARRRDRPREEGEEIEEMEGMGEEGRRGAWGEEGDRTGGRRMSHWDGMESGD